MKRGPGGDGLVAREDLSSIPSIHIKNQVWEHMLVCNPRIKESKTGGSLGVQSQPVLNSKFQTSQYYIVRPYLKETKTKKQDNSIR